MELITKRIHAILFVAGSQGVSKLELVSILNVSQAAIQQGIEQLALTLQEDKLSPIELVNFNGHYRLVTKKEVAADVEQFAQSPLMQKLSRAAIETLAIIAYRQPITRMMIDEIRGVSSSNLLQKLLLRDLICEVGRLEAPGRPVLYGVTDYFMDYFGLCSLDELPEIEPLRLNEEVVSEDLFSTQQLTLDFEEEESEKN